MNIIKAINSVFFDNKVSRPPVSTSDIQDLNWDNCNPKTNGEYFFIDNMAKKWQVMFDVGANVGEYSSRVRNNNKKCKIYCFEPNKKLIPKLKSLRCIAHQKIVGNTNGYESININIVDDTQSSQYRESQTTIKTRIKSITLDSFVRQNKIQSVDFIKIDTEGNEIKVLQGMKDIIASSIVDFIQFEYGGTYRDASTSLKEAYKLLNKHYIICMVLPFGLMPIKYSYHIETYRYSNWIAISRKWGI